MPYINNGGFTTWVNDNDPRVSQQQNTMTTVDRGGAVSSPVTNQTQADRYASGVAPWLVGKGAQAGMSDMDFADMVGNRQKQGLTQDNANFAQQYGIDPTNLRHNQSWMQKADPYIAAAGMGALTLGAGLAAGAGSAVGPASGANAGIGTILGGSSAGTATGAGVAAGGMSMVPPTASFGQTAAGATMSTVPSGYASGAGYMGGAAAGGGAAVGGGSAPASVSPGAAYPGQAAAPIGGAPVAPAGGGGVLSNIGGALNQGSIAKNIATYGPVVWAGVEYSNAKDATQAYQEQLQKAIDSSDPFGPERAKYQQQLDDLLRDPTNFLNSPQVQFASDAAARKMASMGYNQSPAQAQAIADASAGEYYKQANLLAGLAGSSIGPNTQAAVNGLNGLVNSKTNENASLGNVARTAIDTFFGGQGDKSGQTIGDRMFGGSTSLT